MIKLEYHYEKDYTGKNRRAYFISEYYAPNTAGIYQAVRMLCFCFFKYEYAKRILQALNEN